METGSTMIALVLMFSFIGPLTYMIIKQKREERKKSKKFQEQALRHNMSLDLKESLPALLLGLDRNSRKLLVLKEEETQCFDLQELLSCSLNTREVPQHPERPTFISLGLSFKSGKESKLVFYDEDDGVSTEPEFRLRTAEKWEKILSGK